MPFRTRRQHRYLILRDTGFLPFEAKELSKIPFKVPYIDAMIKERYSYLKTAAKQKSTKKNWEKMIKDFYVDRGFTKKNKQNRTILDPWQMMRDFEFKYKNKHPEYESPWEKRRKKWKDFVKKIENTYSKYPAGASYGKKKNAQRIRYLPQGGAELVEEEEEEKNE
jgi:hypothetical protein